MPKKSLLHKHSFTSRFSHWRDHRKSQLCIGLDPDISHISRLDPRFLRHLFPLSSAQADFAAIFDFLCQVINDTADYVIAYKCNLAFYERWHAAGFSLLLKIAEFLKKNYPQHLLIFDGKRGDIGNSMRFYLEAYLPHCDALTVHPYMGLEGLALPPKLSTMMSTAQTSAERSTPDTPDQKTLIVLCLTSNAGAGEFQLSGSPPLFEQVARQVAKRNLEHQSDYWLVVGATQAEKIPNRAGWMKDLHFLVPGLGAQGGVLSACLKVFGKQALFHVGRQIMYPDQAIASTRKASTREQRQRLCLAYNSQTYQS